MPTEKAESTEAAPDLAAVAAWALRTGLTKKRVVRLKPDAAPEITAAPGGWAAGKASAAGGKKDFLAASHRAPGAPPPDGAEEKAAAEDEETPDVAESPYMDLSEAKTRPDAEGELESPDAVAESPPLDLSEAKAPPNAEAPDAAESPYLDLSNEKTPPDAKGEKEEKEEEEAKFPEATPITAAPSGEAKEGPAYLTSLAIDAPKGAVKPTGQEATDSAYLTSMTINVPKGGAKPEGEGTTGPDYITNVLDGLEDDVEPAPVGGVDELERELKTRPLTKFTDPNLDDAKMVQEVKLQQLLSMESLEKDIQAEVDKALASGVDEQMRLIREGKEDQFDLGRGEEKAPAAAQAAYPGSVYADEEKSYPGAVYAGEDEGAEHESEVKGPSAKGGPDKAQASNYTTSVPPQPPSSAASEIEEFEEESPPSMKGSDPIEAKAPKPPEAPKDLVGPDGQPLGEKEVALYTSAKEGIRRLAGEVSQARKELAAVQEQLKQEADPQRQQALAAQAAKLGVTARIKEKRRMGAVQSLAQLGWGPANRAPAAPPEGADPDQASRKQAAVGQMSAARHASNRDVKELKKGLGAAQAGLDAPTDDPTESLLNQEEFRRRGAEKKVPELKRQCREGREMVERLEREGEEARKWLKDTFDDRERRRLAQTDQSQPDRKRFDELEGLLRRHDEKVNGLKSAVAEMEKEVDLWENGPGDEKGLAEFESSYNSHQAWLAAQVREVESLLKEVSVLRKFRPSMETAEKEAGERAEKFAPPPGAAKSEDELKEELRRKTQG